MIDFTTFFHEMHIPMKPSSDSGKNRPS